MWDNRWSGGGQTVQFLVLLANRDRGLWLLMRRARGDALLLLRVANQLEVRGHPIKQRNQLIQDILLQARRYNGPFSRDDSGQKETQK
jgi:hypothetical protein